MNENEEQFYNEALGYAAVGDYEWLNEAAAKLDRIELETIEDAAVNLLATVRRTMATQMYAARHKASSSYTTEEDQ